MELIYLYLEHLILNVWTFYKDENHTLDLPWIDRGCYAHLWGAVWTACHALDLTSSCRYQSSPRSFLPADSVLGTRVLPGRLPNPFTSARASSTCLDRWKGCDPWLSFLAREPPFFFPLNLGQTGGILNLCSLCKAFLFRGKKPASRPSFLKLESPGLRWDTCRLAFGTQQCLWWPGIVGRAWILELGRSRFRCLLCHWLD